MFNDLLRHLAGWLLVLCACWGVLVLVAAALETRGVGQPTRWLGCPPTMRRALLAGMAVALGTSPVAAHATHRPAPDRHAVRALPPPTRPVGPAHVAMRMTVRDGDSLWRLAARRLPDDASDARVLSLVGRVHRRNRAVIGPDPDLIRPGQRLVVPGTNAQAHPEERR